MISDQCVTGSGWSMPVPQSIEGVAAVICGSCRHTPHPDGPCHTCRTDARLQRLELNAGLPLPGERGHIA